jgi:hypothetical protein
MTEIKNNPWKIWGFQSIAYNLHVFWNFTSSGQVSSEVHWYFKRSQCLYMFLKQSQYFEGTTCLLHLVIQKVTNISKKRRASILYIKSHRCFKGAWRHHLHGQYVLALSQIYPSKQCNIEKDLSPMYESTLICFWFILILFSVVKIMWRHRHKRSQRYTASKNYK